MVPKNQIMAAVAPLPTREHEAAPRQTPTAPHPPAKPPAHREHLAGNMPITENVRVAMQGLAANKMRAVLTMLGIIIGVAAVIARIALGQGARQRTLAQIQSLGTNLLLVEPVRNRIGAVRGRAG